MAVALGEAPPPFLSKTFDMVDDDATNAVVSWGREGKSFVVWRTAEFSGELLPKYFKHNNFSSFVRQLNIYGFKKVDPDRWEFANEGFLRGQKHLLRTIIRRKPNHANIQQPQPPTQNLSVHAAVEVGKFGLEEEVQRLKRDKDLLMTELVLLRQQQQDTDVNMRKLVQRLQGMELQHQQMMCFLVNIMQNSGFLAQLVQQNDRNRHIALGSKKKRLSKQANNFSGERSSPDGQIIKFQAFKEAAKAFLMQILKMDISALETRNNPINLLIDNGPSSLEEVGTMSSDCNPSVMINEVPQSSTTMVPSNPDFSVISPPLDQVNIRSPSDIVDTVSSHSGFLPSSPLKILSGPPQLQGVSADSNVLPNDKYIALDDENMYCSPFTAGVNEQVPRFNENFSQDNFFLDEDNLSVNDYSYWEQFLTLSPPTSDPQGADPSMQDDGMELQTEPDSSWSNADIIAHLTQQMGLTADPVQ